MDSPSFTLHQTHTRIVLLLAQFKTTLINKENQEMEEKNQDNNKPIENQQNENENPKSTSEWKDILWSIAGVIITVFLIFFTIRGVKATIQSHRERKEEQRKETLARQQSIWSVDWDDYEHLIPAPQSLDSFLSYYDGDAFSLEALDQLLAEPMSINRPCNIVLDSDPEVFAKRYIAPMRVPIDLYARTADEFVASLKYNASLSSEFWEWINKCIQFNNHIAHINCDFVERPQKYDVAVSRVVAHLKEYLAHDGPHYDRIFEETCNDNGLWNWFESQNKIIEIDSLYYRAVNIVKNPYRQFEVFVYRLVEEFDIPADRIFQWLENCPFWIEDDDITLDGETVLPPPPTLICETIFDFEGDTIWLSDVAAEWVVELKSALNDGVEDWFFLTNYYIGLENVIYDYFSHCCYYNDFNEIMANSIKSKIREGIMQPDVFETLVAWMSPTVTETLQQLNAHQKRSISEGIEHLIDYLHNGDYECDLEYEKLIKAPISQGFALEYAPDDFIIIDGEIYEGMEHKLHRENEVRLFVSLQYGVSKQRVEQLLKKVLDIVKQ